MGFPLNKALSDKEKKEREKFLALAVSKECVGRFAEIDPNLCPTDKIQRRLDNLYELGFDAKKLAEKNPTILQRKRIKVRIRYFLIAATFLKLDPHTDVHYFFMTRPQLWSVGDHKLDIIFALAQMVESNVTPQRICNLITLNLESILVTYISGYRDDLIALQREAKKCAHEKDVTQCQRIIIDCNDKLPQNVYNLYKNFFL